MFCLLTLGSRYGLPTRSGTVLRISLWAPVSVSVGDVYLLAGEEGGREGVSAEHFEISGYAAIYELGDIGAPCWQLGHCKHGLCFFLEKKRARLRGTITRSPSLVPFCRFLWGERSPTKIDYRKKRVPLC